MALFAERRESDVLTAIQKKICGGFDVEGDGRD